MSALLRLAGRSAILSLVGSCVLLVLVQYCQVIQRNVELSHELAKTDRQIAALQALKVHQIGEIRRLSDPQGAIPEIHDRLKLVGKNEAIIYVQGGIPSPAPAPVP